MKRCCSSLDPTHLAPLDLVPPVHEVLHDIEYDRARQSHVHIMPRHTRRLKYTNRIPNESIDMLEIKNPSIIIILTREQRL